MGWRRQGIGRGVTVAARLAAAPLVIVVALAMLPTRTRSAASSTGALRDRMAAVAAGPDAGAVRASFAALLSDPAFGRLTGALAARHDLDPFARDLLRAALAVAGSSSAVAGRLLDTPATTVDRHRLEALRRVLRANPALARIAAAGSALQRQAWPAQLAVERTRAQLLTLASRSTAVTAVAGGADPALARVAELARSDAWRAGARSVARILDDAGAAAFVRTLPPLVAAGYLGGPTLLAPAAPSGPSSTSTAAGLRLAAGVVIVAYAVADGSRPALASALTTAPAVAAG